jgi:hypothetical protein
MTIKPGIYFSMPEEEYRALPALNYSGMKDLQRSPARFWARSPFNTGQAAPLIPSQADIRAEEGPEEEYLTIGKAFDVRLLSGRGAFYKQFVAALDPAEFNGTCLRTLEDLKAACRAAEIAVSGNKDALIERLIAVDPSKEAVIWDRMVAKYAAAHDGKTFLSRKWMDKVEAAAVLLDRDPVLGKAFVGGASQVTIVWRDEVIGVDCKARLDKLKGAMVGDLKTFQQRPDNTLERRQAVRREIVNRSYHIQAAHYLEAASHAARFLKDGLTDAANPKYDDTGFLQSLLADKPKTYLLIFQVKDIPPECIGVEFSPEAQEKMILFERARAFIQSMKQTYRDCLEHYGTDTPWIMPGTIETMGDDDVPGWMLT